MQRVLVLGSSGAGKSTLSKKLAAVTKLPVISLDHLFWKPGWEESTAEEFDGKLSAALEQDNWIIEGNYNRTLPRRLDKADTVIMLDFNRFLCLYRAFKRLLIDKGEQAEGCPQKVDAEFVKYILWDYQRENRKNIFNFVSQYPDKNWVILKSPRDVKTYINKIESAACPSPKL